MIEKREQIRGIWYTISAFILWGILPLYWKALKSVPPPQILAHRIVWSSVFVLILMIIRRNIPDLRRALTSKRDVLFFCLSALCLGINWFIYILAVNTSRVVESSMGYFINPLISVFLGMIFLREKLGFLQIIAVLLAISGVLYMTLRYGSIPWIALSLAFSFGLYGLLRKLTNTDSLIALFYHTAFLAPFAILYLAVQGWRGNGAVGTASAVVHLLLAGAGVVTAVPLIWFANGVQRIPLSTVGFTQYLAPSLMLLLGVLLFGESFTRTHLISFSLIWGGLLLFSLTHTKLLRGIDARWSTRKS
jgi:chloramphenicol-sensitive protein RarD